MATYANIQIQRNVVGDPFRITVIPTNGGAFDTSRGVISQAFNYGDGKEVLNALSLTANQFVYEMLKSGSIDHNFQILLTSDSTGIGVQSLSGDGMKVVGFFTDKQTEMDQNPVEHSRKK